jgi:hypothetical protein
MGAEAMSPYVLDAVFWVLGIRGHIPKNGDFHAGRGESSSAGHRLLRVLAAFVLVVAVLSLALWAAVWLAIKLL